jgi:TetR/AcrR family transcriptional regulator, transcriptional repressor for nem operon
MMRERGLVGASVNEVMAAAGLTRGGFYAHFPDKAEMIAEALGLAFDDARSALLGSIPEEGEAWAEHAAGRYLSQKHLDSPGTGCVVTSLGPEVARSEPVVKKAFQRGVESMLDGIKTKLGGTREDAIMFLATCIGAVTLGRAVHDRALSDEIREAAKKALRKGR